MYLEFNCKDYPGESTLSIENDTGCLHVRITEDENDVDGGTSCCMSLTLHDAESLLNLLPKMIETLKGENDE